MHKQKQTVITCGWLLVAVATVYVFGVFLCFVIILPPLSLSFSHQWANNAVVQCHCVAWQTPADADADAAAVMLYQVHVFLHRGTKKHFHSSYFVLYVKRLDLFLAFNISWISLERSLT